MTTHFEMPEIKEEETVFIRHAGEMRFPEVRAEVVELLSFRFQNELNHVQFMGGFGKAHHGHDSFVEDNRALLMEWERQTRRVRQLGSELTQLGADAQEMLDACNYSLIGGARTQSLFSTEIEDWEDMLVWRWLRARAWSYRSTVEFGSVYVPLSQYAFDQYFDLGLSRWPAASTREPVERVVKFYQSGLHERFLESLKKWYPLAHAFMQVGREKQEELVDMRVWCRPLDMAASMFESCVRDDLREVGVPARHLGN